MGFPHEMFEGETPQPLIWREPAKAETVARFPSSLRQIASHPGGRIWAGAFGDHVYLITLERRADDE